MSKKANESEKIDVKQAEVKARKEAEEAKKAKERAKKEAQEAKERAKGEAQEAVSGELYEGIVPLTIVPPIDLGQVRKLEEHLSQVQDLRLVLVGGSVDEGTEIVVSADKPIPLIDVLREMPPVEQVAKKGKKIQITLRTE